MLVERRTGGLEIGVTASIIGKERLDTASESMIGDKNGKDGEKIHREHQLPTLGELGKQISRLHQSQKVLQKFSRVKAATVTEILRRLTKADEQREDPKYREKYQENIEWAKEELGKKFPAVGKIFELSKTGRLDKEQIIPIPKNNFL